MGKVYSNFGFCMLFVFLLKALTGQTDGRRSKTSNAAH